MNDEIWEELKRHNTQSDISKSIKTQAKNNKDREERIKSVRNLSDDELAKRLLTIKSNCNKCIYQDGVYSKGVLSRWCLLFDGVNYIDECWEEGRTASCPYYKI